VIPLRKATQPGIAPFVLLGTRVFAPLDLMSPSREEERSSRSALYLATPAVLRYLGIDPTTVASGTDFLVDRSAKTDDLSIPDMRSRKKVPVTNVQRIDLGHHLFGSDSAESPPTFITLNGLRRHGWSQIPAGWLVDSTRTLTSDQIADARTVAADAGLTVEARHGKPSFAKTMAIATGAGALLALAILAMTVGLIRSESAGDLRTLTATGATSGIRRRLTATTAGALALLGTLLGVAGAYVVLAATYYDDLGYLSDVPVLYLVLAVLGVPLAATAAGWLLAGREPRAIARTALE
jgi:putative ABC transport system permease protein